MRKENEARRAAAVYTILKTQTDMEHPMSMPVLLSRLETYGIHAERRSIYHVLEILNAFGADIHHTRAGYAMRHTFTPAEVTLLTGAVQNTISISRAATDRLTDKLKNLLSRQQQKTLFANPYAPGKTDNDKVLTNLDLILTAVTKANPVEFTYVDRLFRGAVKYRKNAGRYRGIPRAVLYNQGRCYIVFYSEHYRNFANYRLDKITRVIRREETISLPPFDCAEWMNRSFQMYTDQAETITLHCQSSMAPILFDQFGDTGLLQAEDKPGLTVSIHVAITPGLIGWLVQFQNRCTVIQPAHLIAKLKTLALQLQQQYEHEGETK